MPKYHLSEKASKDIKEIWRYTVQTWSLSQAKIYDTTLLHAIENIAENPYTGKPYDHVRRGYRRYTVKKHFIFYKVHGRIVEIVRVLHQQMDIDELL